MKKGWEQKPFENCVEPVEYTRKIQRKDFLAEGQFPIVSQEAEFTNGYWDDEADVFKVSRPVVIFGDHTQVLKYVDFDFVLGADGVRILQPRSFLSPKFFYYQLQAAELPTLGYARHYRLLKELEMCVPPLVEQQRIVGLLDKAFDDIATIKTNAEKNHQNARALFESHLHFVFTQRGKEWVDTTLGEACENLDSKRVPITKSKRHAGKYPYYGASGIVDYVNDYIFDEDLLLVSEDGANLLARTYPIAFSISGKVWVNNHAHVLRFPDIASQRFVEFYLNSIKLDPYVSGMAQPKLNQKLLNSIPFPLPPLLQRQEIVANLDSLKAESKNLESIFQRKLTKLEELKKSLLHQAITGEL